MGIEVVIYKAIEDTHLGCLAKTKQQNRGFLTSVWELPSHRLLIEVTVLAMNQIKK